jgi:hypothetical protein
MLPGGSVNGPPQNARMNPGGGTGPIPGNGNVGVPNPGGTPVGIGGGTLGGEQMHPLVQQYAQMQAQHAANAATLAAHPAAPLFGNAGGIAGAGGAATGMHAPTTPASPAGFGGTPSAGGAFPLQLPSGQQIGYQMGVNQAGHDAATGLAGSEYRASQIINGMRPELQWMGHQDNLARYQQMAQNDERGVGNRGVGAEAFNNLLAGQGHNLGNYERSVGNALAGTGLTQEQIKQRYGYQLQNLLNHKNLALNAFASRSVK